ncbi:TetR/AcrR family transcriptional regulator [Luteococcus sp. Sow4_B9]|uniref:TetR/AcrR family transcriptional regulator n=1 Tax=Luteococcus sp. Sow4_B9 TaxID=3438792 RepID=UPI003F964125
MVVTSRRAEIIAAAVTLFDQRGYWGTSMEDIARRIGMRASSLYNHCSSKQELLGEICVLGMERLIQEHDERLAGLDDPVERIRVAMDVHVQIHARHAPDVRVSNREVMSLEEPWAGRARQACRDYVRRWVQIVDDGIGRGVFHSDDPKINAYFMIDMATGVSVWFQPDRRYTLDELSDRYANQALRMLGVGQP